MVITDNRQLAKLSCVNLLKFIKPGSVRRVAKRFFGFLCGKVETGWTGKFVLWAGLL